MQTRDKSEQGVIEATGQGVVSAKPDVAILRLGVISEAKKPAKASQQNAELMTAVIEAVKKLGIPESAIQTSSLYLQPILKWVEADQKHVLVGYRAQNVVTVRTAVELAGPIYDAGIEAGANTAGGIGFSVEDETELRRAALELATQRAVDEIKTVAAALGVTLGEPMQAQVLATGGYPRPMELAFNKSADFETPVMAGQIDIDAQVRVVYAIKP